MSTQTEGQRGADAYAALEEESLCGGFQLTAAANADRVALRLPDDSVSITWGEYAQRVEKLANGLASLGIGKGDTVALLLTNRPEHNLIDTAALHTGGVPFSIYQTNPVDTILPLLDNSGATVLVTEPAFLERARAAFAQHDGLKHLVLLDAEPEGDGEIAFADLESRTAENFDFEASWKAVKSDDIATIVYTSGTTGLPKGVQHTHHGMLYGQRSMAGLCPVTPEGRVVSFLPMAHIAERYISHYGSIGFGYSITCCPDPAQIGVALASSKPTRFFAVPRIYEKFRGAVLNMASAEPEGPLAQAIERGLERVKAEQAGEDAPGISEQDAAVTKAVREKLGWGELEWCAVAAAPTPLAVLEFWHALGVRIAELWGMSETVLSTSNPMHKVKLGTVGYHLPGVEVDLAEDGEIIVRGPNVMVGYRNDPEQTKEAIDADGWMHTGDIATRDDEGYLTIVDRKKELIINSAGKNMSPTHIEGFLKEECGLIAQAVAIGDGKQFVTALIVLDQEGVTAHAERAGVSSDITAFCADESVQKLIADGVTAANERLPRVEQVKYHTVIAEYWAPGGDQITPTQKLKRKPISEQYASEIEAMYANAS